MNINILRTGTVTIRKLKQNFQAKLQSKKVVEYIPNAKAPIFIWSPTVQFSTTYVKRKIDN